MHGDLRKKSEKSKKIEKEEENMKKVKFSSFIYSKWQIETF